MKNRKSWYVARTLVILSIPLVMFTSCPNPVNLLSVLTTIVSESSPPLLIPAEISFVDTDADNGEIAGTFSFPAAEDETGITEYHLYWGVSADQKLPGWDTPALIFPAGSSSYVNTFGTDYGIPAGATHFIVHSANDSGESADSVVLDIPDLSCEQLADIRSGPIGSYPSNFFGFDGRVYFSASDGPDDGSAASPNGNELWSYNPETESAQLEYDIINASGADDSGNPKRFLQFDNKIFFIARNGVNVNGLYSLSPRNGFEKKQYALYADRPDTGPIENASYITTLDSMLYIAAFESGYEWEIYDFPHKLNLMIPQVGYRLTNTSISSLLSIPFFAELNGTVYFKVDGGDGFGIELWKLDGTPPTDIVRVTDINTGGDAGIQWIVTYRDKLYFQARDDFSNSDLWSFDGSNATLVSDSSVTRGPTYLTVCNDKLYFQAYNSSNDYMLWEYDESGPPVSVTPSTLRVYDITPPIEFMGNVYFTAFPTSTSDVELYVYDGTSVSRVKDIHSGLGASNPESLYAYQNTMYFRATDGNDGEELWGLWID